MNKTKKYLPKDREEILLKWHKMVSGVKWYAMK